MKNLVKCFHLCTIIACVYAAGKPHRTAKYFRDMPVAPRLSTAEYPSYNIFEPDGPGTYAFGYEIEDPRTGNVQFRDEEKLRNGTVRGSYGFMQINGLVSITKFISDYMGYRARTEIKRHQNGHPVAPVPSVDHTTRFPQLDQDKMTISPEVAAMLLQQQINVNPTYNPLYDQNVIDPQYAAAILSNLDSQRFEPPANNYNYNPMQNSFFDPPAQGNPFNNFVQQFPSNLNPSNLYNNLQTNFPNIIPQNNPFQNFNNPIPNWINSAQSGFQQIIPQNNPLNNFFQSQSLNGNRFQNMRPSNVYSDPINASTQSSVHRIPTTKRKKVVATRKPGTKTRENSWFEEFLDSRKREAVLNMGESSVVTVTPMVASSS